MQLLSREPDSTTLAPLQKTANRRTVPNTPRGAGGIRTPGALRHSGFQDRRLQPLGHHSGRPSILRVNVAPVKSLYEQHKKVVRVENFPSGEKLLEK